MKISNLDELCKLITIGDMQNQIIQNKIVQLAVLLTILAFTFSCSKNLDTSEKVIPYTIGEVLLSDDFSGKLSLWAIEGESPEIIDGKLEFDNSGVSVAWLRPSLVGNIMIEYDVTIPQQKEQVGTESSFGCLAMAVNPDGPNNFFASSQERSGQLSGYDNLNLYYFELCRDKKNSLRIFRYNDGKQERLNQKSKSSYKDASDNKYHVKLHFFKGLIECYINDECLWRNEDPQPYTKGNFGLTVNACRIIFDNVVITHLSLP